MCGFITVHRQITDWEWYLDLNTRSLFLHLLIVANHAPSKWKGHDILRGQRLTSFDALSRECALSVQSVRTSLNRLKSTGEITSKSTSSFTLITIINYDTYQTIGSKPNKQINKPANKQLTNDQQTTNNKQQCKPEKQEEPVLAPQTQTRKSFKKLMSPDDFIAEGKTPVKLPDGTISQKVFLTTDQKEKLVLAFKKQFGLDCFGEYLQLAIQKLDNYITNHKKGREYVDHYKVILDWPLEKAIQKFNLDQQQRGHNERRLRNS